MHGCAAGFVRPDSWRSTAIRMMPNARKLRCKACLIVRAQRPVSKNESKFGAEALLLARAVMTDWRIAKVIRLPQPPRGELFLPIDIRGKKSVTGLRQMGSRFAC